MTVSEASEALEQALRSADGERLVTEPIEISTRFTVGALEEDAARELADWWRSQAPCSAVTVEGASVTVDFGTLDAACTFNGRTYAGVTEITIVENWAFIDVHHDWSGLTNGEITVDGEADVGWSPDDPTRRIGHALSWVDADGQTIDVTGERSQHFVMADLGLGSGLRVDGERSWTSEEDEEWRLDIDQAEVRLQDPAPQDGAWTVTSPRGKELVLDFERLDSDTIEVRLTGAREDLVYHLGADGIPQRVE